MMKADAIVGTAVAVMQQSADCKMLCLEFLNMGAAGQSVNVQIDWLVLPGSSAMLSKLFFQRLCGAGKPGPNSYERKCHCMHVCLLVPTLADALESSTACHTASWYLDAKNQALLGGADTADDGVTALSPNHVPAWRS